MSPIQSTARTRPGFNLTELSTLKLLIGAGCTCAALWVAIALTVSG